MQLERTFSQIWQKYTQVLNKHLKHENFAFRTKIYSRLHDYSRKIVHSNGLDNVVKNNTKDTPIYYTKHPYIKI